MCEREPGHDPPHCEDSCEWAVGPELTGTDFAAFEEHCREHGAAAADTPAAFAAWLHDRSGGSWDGPVDQTGEPPHV